MRRGVLPAFLLCLLVSPAWGFSGAIQAVLGAPTATAADTTAPSLSSATIPSAGTSITLSFGEAVSVGAGGNAGWTISPSGGAATLTYSSGAGTAALVYGLNRTINSGETATVAYTQPGNGLEDGAGNDLGTIATAACTNNSTQGGACTAFYTQSTGTSSSDYFQYYPSGVFRTETASRTLCQADIYIQAVNGDISAKTMALRIYTTDASHNIVTLLGTSDTKSSITTGNLTFTFASPVALSADTEYAYVFWLSAYSSARPQPATTSSNVDSATTMAYWNGSTKAMLGSSTAADFRLVLYGQ